MANILVIEHVRQWFDTYKDSLDDVQSYRIQAGIVEKELAQGRKWLIEFEANPDLKKETEELKADIIEATELLSELTKRVQDLERV